MESNKGIITVEVSIISPEKFLNLLWNRNIKISKIKKINITTVRFEVNYDDYEDVKELVLKLKGKSKIVSSKGFIFLIERLKRQASIIAGILVFCVGLYILSTHIWSIEINTKQNISPYEIRKVLTSIGVKPGIKKSDIDVYSLEGELQGINKDILWIRARIEGSALKIVLEEKVTPPNIEKESNEGDCVAKMDGEIKRIYVSSGTPKVSPGDIVKEGDVLISATQGSEGKEILPTEAKGTVIANTFCEKEMEILLKGKKIESTGKKDKDIYLNLWGNKIYLKKAVNNFKYYDKIKDDNTLINKVTYFERDEKYVDLDRNAEIKKGTEKLEKSLLKNLSNEARISDKNISVEDLGNGKIRLKVIFIVEQSII